MVKRVDLKLTVPVDIVKRAQALVIPFRHKFGTGTRAAVVRYVLTLGLQAAEAELGAKKQA